MDKRQFIKQWMKTFEPDTFKTGQNGRYFYRSEDLSSGIDLEIFFEELLEDYESALAENTPTSEEQLVTPAVSGSFLKELAHEHINKCKDMVYKLYGRNAGNELEGDYGSWRDWEARLILFGRELLKNLR